MKKILIVFLMLFTSSFCFAKGQSDNFEAGIGYHHINTRTTVFYDGSGEKRMYGPIGMETFIPSFAINLSYITYYTENFGLGIYGNLSFPQNLEVKSVGERPEIPEGFDEEIPEMDGSKGAFSMDFLLGPELKVYNSEKIDISLVAGLHWYLLFSSPHYGSDKDSYSNQIGIGTNVTAKYHFTPRIYAYGRFQFTYDLYATESNGGTAGSGTLFGPTGKPGEKSEGKLSAWGLAPTIGIGFKF
jgi:hypothetical protein